ncbi:uncharacterized protein BDV14DRAFT_181075 [Aspergillus stella-maris]|uniref:uncharacterized protein n=1 Tax=Aspergillus stella-maris TaxID=1810926 RepID=UPI003CCCFE06
MTSKDEVMRVFKQHGISDQDAKKAFEKVDIDNDDEMPRSGTYMYFSSVCNRRWLTKVCLWKWSTRSLMLWE